MDNYYNTIRAQGADLSTKRIKNRKQTDVVLQFFKDHALRDFTPSEVHSQGLFRCPLTSVRRAITDLTKAGELMRTNNQRVGDYGTMNNCWQLSYGQVSLF